MDSGPVCHTTQCCQRSHLPPKTALQWKSQPKLMTQTTAAHHGTTWRKAKKRNQTRTRGPPRKMDQQWQLQTTPTNLTMIAYHGTTWRTTKILMKSTQAMTMTERQHPLTQQYPTVQHHPPLANLTSAASLPKTPMDYADNPVMPIANH